MTWDKTVHLEDIGENLPSEDDAHFLLVVNGASAGMRIEIRTEPRIIGRGDTAGVHLDDPGISGLHCLVHLRSGLLVAEDLDSTNGTFLDGRRLSEPTEVPVGSILQVARTRLRHEVRTRAEFRREKELEEEIDKAVTYVRSLLPPPLSEGELHTEWRFIPSAHLGGDAFGYHRLDGNRTALYLLDVCGHGVGAALHSVSAINSIRRQTLGAADFGRPASVLEALNEAYPMEDHGEMFFTIWYGVYDAPRRRLSYATAGHPPAYLIPPTRRDPASLRTKAMPIGILPVTTFVQDETDVEPGSWLYVFSDGAFEILTTEGSQWTLEDLAAVLAEPPIEGLSEPDRVERRIRGLMAGENFTDDFSLLCVNFAP